MTSQNFTGLTPLSAVQLPDHPIPLFVPRRSAGTPHADWVTYDAPVPQAWDRMAERKGFLINRRIRDRYHVALECRTCGAHTAQKTYTLRTAQPRCGGCATAGQQTRAQDAGLVLLHRDPEDRHYGIFRAECGHIVRRQFAFIHRMQRGDTDLRCATCLVAREAKEARHHGWTRLGPDPQNRQNYRLYRHACGHTQSIAAVNMRWGQCDCAHCGGSWGARPSFLYLAQIRFPHDGLTVVKFGYSAHPNKRFRHQLGLPGSAQVTFLRLLPMPSGHAACTVERPANTALARTHPDAVVPPSLYAGLINVVSEIYWPELLPEINRVLDRIAAATVPHPD